VLLTPVVVTKENIADTVIEDGFYEPSEICSGEFAKACTDAGIG
jgi:D-xylose transport system substrate-binding protein